MDQFQSKKSINKIFNPRFVIKN